jgi:hypothetical protein
MFFLLIMLDSVEELKVILGIIASKVSSPVAIFYIVFLLVLVALGLLVFKKTINEISNKHQKEICMLFLGVLLGGTLFYVVFSFGLVDSDAGKTEIVQKNSLQVAYNDDFENRNGPADIDPWTTRHDNKSYSGRISEEEKHFGNYSLRLKVDMTDYDYNDIEKRDEYGSIGIASAKHSEVKVIEAWVLVPESEQVIGSTFSSHIIAYFNDSSSRNIAFFGETEEIKPGRWTPIFLGVFYEAKCSDPNIEWNCNFEWDGTIDALYLTVWSDQPYKGSIYFDDITIWK